jgi:sodium-independent sulfate anion transporter 11
VYLIEQYISQGRTFLDRALHFGAGFLVEFVSVPVVAGFTSASAIIIASSQVKGLFGLSYSSEGFVESWRKLFEHIGSTRLWDTVLGVCCIISLLCLRVSSEVTPSNRLQHLLSSHEHLPD